MPWSAVEEVIEDAKAIHFDGCHKIYLSMDDEQVRESEGYGYESVKPEMETLRKWFKESCPLVFVSAMYTNHADPDAGYVHLIEQGEFE